MRRTGDNSTTQPTKTYKAPEKKKRDMPMKKVSRVIDVQKKNNQVKNNFTGPVTDPRACFNRSIWSPSINRQQLPLGKANLRLGEFDESTPEPPMETTLTA